MLQSWGYRVRENAGCVLLLFVLPLLACAPSLFQNALPFAAGGILSLPPWEELAAGKTDTDPLSTWQLSTSWPAYQFIHAHRHDLGALFWNPEVGLGQPFLANVQNRCFSFFTVPFYLFDLQSAWALSLWLKLVVAGLAAYYAARRYGFTAGFAFVVALIFQWSGPVFRWGAEPMGDILPWFPLLLLSVDRLLLGHFRAWPLLATVVVLMALGGDVRILAVLLGILVAYMVLRRLREPHHVHLATAFSGLLLGLVTGLGLAAPQLVPYFTLLREGTTAGGAYPWALTPDTLLGIFGAAFHENATGVRNPLAELVDIGRVPVLLLGLWFTIRQFVERPIRHRVECLGAAALLAAAVPFAVQGFLAHLPVLRLFHPAHYLVALALPLALLSASVVETWLHLNAEECKKVLFRMALVLPVYWGGLLAASVLVTRAADGAAWGPAGMFAIVLGVVAILFAVTLLHPNPRLMAVGIATTLLVLIAFGRIPRLPQSDRAQIFPETRLIQALRAVGTRVGGSPALENWPLDANRIPALHAQSTVTLHRTAQFLKRVEANPLLQRRAGVGSLLLQRSDIQGPYAAVRADLNILDVFDSGAVLFRDLAAEPPFRIAHAVQPEGENNVDSLQLDSLPILEGVAMPPREGPFEDSIRLTDIPKHTEIALAVESNQPGILIVTTAWYPNWRAWIDGKMADVYPVDGVLQGVELVAGAHEVRLRFELNDFRVGVYVCIGFALLLLFGVYQATRPIKHQN